MHYIRRASAMGQVEELPADVPPHSSDHNDRVGGWISRQDVDRSLQVPFSVLCCILLYCVVLYRIVLYCVVLHRIGSCTVPTLVRYYCIVIFSSIDLDLNLELVLRESNRSFA